jgi:SRSO17 transposase
LAEIPDLGERLSNFCEQFRPLMQTKTHDTSQYGFDYVSGLLRLDTKRNITEISRQVGVASQNMQQFISDSPWAGPGLIEAVQNQVKIHPAFAEAVAVVDESADDKGGAVSAGAGRQHNGRLGKVELSQVGVFLALVTPRASVWVDGELFVPASWFEPDQAALRQRVGLPAQRAFQTKPELAWRLIERARANGLPFVAVDMDDLYGRNRPLRRRLEAAQIEYYGDIPANTMVYLDQPRFETKLTKRGKPAKHKRVVAQHRCQAQDLLTQPDLAWTRLTLRPTERGHLTADWVRCRVWLVEGEEAYQRWLLIRRDPKQVTYTLSNAPLQTSLETMAWRKSHRAFIERSNQDGKSEFGWDEFQAIKYRAWQHQLALTTLAAWFVADTRLDWQARFATDPALLAQYETDVLPLLSVSNVRTLLRAALPLPQLTSEQATALVIEHLLNRTLSRKSRLHKGRGSET